MQMDSQEGSSQGRWGLEEHYRHQLSSRAVLKRPVPLLVQLWSGIPPPPESLSHPISHPEDTAEEQKHIHHQGEPHTTDNLLLYEGKIDHLLTLQQELLKAVRVMQSVVLRVERGKKKE